MTYDAGNRKDVRKLEKAAKHAEHARIEYTRRIMSEALGRVWMHSLLARCNVFHTPFVRGAADITAFNCGTQNVGLQLFADVIVNCPTEYILMMQEASHKELSNDRHDSDNRSPSGQSAGGEPSRRDHEGPDPSSGDYDPYATREET